MKLQSTVNKLIFKTVNNYFMLLKYNKITNFIFDHNQNKHDK